MQYVKINSDASELYHFGVKGMKWGVITKKDSTSRRPSREKKNLKTSTFEKRELKAVKFEKLASESKNPKRKAMYLKEAERARAGKLSRRQRQVLVGASVVAAYATYKLVDSGEAQRLIENGKAAMGGKKFEWKRNEILADKNLTPDEVFSKVVSRINDDYGKPGTTNNCRRCTFAYIRSRQGYDVVATKTLSATGQTNINLYNVTTDKNKLRGGIFGAYKAIYSEDDKYDAFKEFLDNEKKDIYSPIDIKNALKLKDGDVVSGNIFKALSKMPNNSCGELNMQWDIGGGHSMAWEVIKGNPVIFDAQTKQMYDTPDKLKELAARMTTVNYSRLDNVNLDEKIIGRWMKNAK